MYERTYTAKVLTQNAPIAPKRKRKAPLKTILWIIIACAIVGGAVFLIKWPKLQVRHIEVSGTNVVDPEEVELLLQSRIEGSYLHIFPHTSMLLVPTATFTKLIQKTYPRFATVNVRRKGVDTLTVTVTERDGKYLWCENEEKCFFMTDDGLVFAEAPFFSGDAYVKIFIGAVADLPFAPLSDTQVAIVHTLLDRLPTLSIKPTEFRQLSEHELDIIFLHDDHRARLIIDPQNDIEATLEDLATALGTEPLKSKYRTSTHILEYIDARFSNKVVYKFQ